jgi:hypothetical protein
VPDSPGNPVSIQNVKIEGVYLIYTKQHLVFFWGTEKKFRIVEIIT